MSTALGMYVLLRMDDGIVRVNDILILISNWGPCE